MTNKQWQWPQGDLHFQQFQWQTYQSRARERFRELVQDHVLDRTEAPITGMERAELIIDVGAHVGTWTVPMTEWAWEVWAFEPIHAGCLHENVQNFAARPRTGLGCLTRIYDRVLSDQRGPVEFWQRTDNSGDSGIGLGENNHRQRLICERDLLDDYQTDQHLTGIKIDTQGHELSVLKGAEQWIRRDLPVICVELNQGHPDSEQLLEDWGYRLESRQGKDWLWINPEG